MGNCFPCLLSRMPKTLDSMTESKENDVIEQQSLDSMTESRRKNDAIEQQSLDSMMENKKNDVIEQQSLNSMTENKKNDVIEQQIYPYDDLVIHVTPKKTVSCGYQSLDAMTENKKNEVIEQRSYLSDDLIFHEILTRLPVKSIIRFKSVSKQWYSTLSSSKFASFYLTKSPFPRPSAPVNTLFIMSQTDCYLFTYDDDDQISGIFEDNLVKLDVDFGDKGNLIVSGCCNGLICLSKPFGEYFFLWNPATRKLHKYASDGCLTGIDNIGIPFVASGFGYVSSVDDYKYVRISTLGWGSGQASNIAHIFSLKENKWRKIEFGQDVVFPYGHPMLLNEKIYWVGYREQVGTLLVCFDFELEKFDIIKLNLAKFSYLGVMGAHLGESEYNNVAKGDELIIQIVGSTIIDKSIDLPEGMLLDMDSQMIGYTRTGVFFVTVKSNAGVDVTQDRCSRTLWLVESGTKPVQCKTLMKFNAPLDIARYVPSLVSPFPIDELSDA